MLRSTLGNPNNMLSQCQKMSKGDDYGGFSTRDNDLILLWFLWVCHIKKLYFVEITSKSPNQAFTLVNIDDLYC